ncbi:hypothetical protein TURU_137583 [Turdus rufiventris]|nr:hypothetical protein TURU_137583 [Turdus rufiventris]
MAPRIRLSLSKPLPTIRETHEEAMEDPSSNPKHGSAAASPDSYSSDDYIQSICHLARPTFPALLESRRKVLTFFTISSVGDDRAGPCEITAQLNMHSSLDKAVLQLYITHLLQMYFGLDQGGDGD